jgi:bifunctional NMN adenylyltransferase/nudix hydrolase
MNRTVGVIVGRFQTPRLTPGHVHLLNTALLQNDEVILFIGSTPVRNSIPDPIPFVWRASMVQADPRLFRAGKRFQIVELPDRGSDAIWSAILHAKIQELTARGQFRTMDFEQVDVIRLYGSRDSSFLKGFDISEVETPYEKVELLPFSNFSATELRSQVANKFPSGTDTDDYIREGMIIASQSRYPIVYSTVDVAIFDVIDGKVGVWLGRKPGATQFRFIGGFTEPTSESDEEDAAREVMEETGLTVHNVTYIGNAKIDDWRYRKTQDKIRTRFFAAKAINSNACAADDIEDVRFFPIENLFTSVLVNEHGPLLQMLAKWVATDAGTSFVNNIVLDPLWKISYTPNI